MKVKIVKKKYIFQNWHNLKRVCFNEEINLLFKKLVHYLVNSNILRKYTFGKSFDKLDNILNHKIIVWLIVYFLKYFTLFVKNTLSVLT